MTDGSSFDIVEGRTVVRMTSAVTFHIPVECIDDLMKRARELDDDNNGSHAIRYTIPQAFQVVFHMDPTWLFSSLWGWVFDGPDNMWDGVKHVDEGTPDLVIQEEEVIEWPQT